MFFFLNVIVVTFHLCREAKTELSDEPLECLVREPLVIAKLYSAVDSGVTLALGHEGIKIIHQLIPDEAKFQDNGA